MLKSAAIAACLVAFCALAPAQAKNEAVKVSVDNALGIPEAQGRFDGSVKFYFGNTAHPDIVQSFGPATSEGAGEAMRMPTPEYSCAWVFLQALKRLEVQAKKAGANAVINIVSSDGNAPFQSDTQIECMAGYVAMHMSLAGELVKTR